jgi:hypothetical protein
MKKVFLLLFTLATFNSFALSVSYKRITQIESVKLLESISNFEVFTGKQLHVSIFKSSIGSGSAKLPESDEVSYNFIFCVAHFDENPDSKVFSTGPFINPIISNKADSGDSIDFIIETGVFDNRKKVKLTVSQYGIQIK